MNNRFCVKFVNGIWTIFDRLTYTNCEPDLRTYKQALALLNAPPQVPRVAKTAHTKEAQWG
jgi:hypothetical protein